MAGRRRRDTAPEVPRCALWLPVHVCLSPAPLAAGREPPVSRPPRSVPAPVVALTTGDLFDRGAAEPVVLGLDASLTKIGASVIGAETGAHTTTVFRSKTTGTRRLDEIYAYVTDLSRFLAQRFVLAHITMEEYAWGIRGGKTFSIGEGGGAVKLALLHALGDVELAYPTMVSTTALKKYTLGSGRAEKSQMLLAVYRKWGVEFSKDDQADAYALARVGLALLSGETEFAYEAEVVSSLERHTTWQRR